MKSEIRSLKADAAIKNNEIIGLKSALASTQSSNSITKRNLQAIDPDNSTCVPLIEECTKILPPDIAIDIDGDITYQDNRIITNGCEENCVTFNLEGPEFEFSGDNQVTLVNTTIKYTDESRNAFACLENCNNDIFNNYTYDGSEEEFDALVRSIVQDELKKNEDECTNIESRKSCIKQSACKWNGLLGCISGKSGGEGNTRKGRGHGH